MADDVDAAVQDLATVLPRATAAIGSDWCRLPVTRRDDPSYRERVYCYDLYHQLRMLTASRRTSQSSFALSGEIDKISLDAVVPGSADKPDLAWHRPGTDDNAVVVEVKSAPANHAGLVKTS